MKHFLHHSETQKKIETLDKNYFLGFLVHRKNLLADLYLLLVPFVAALIKTILFSTRKIFPYLCRSSLKQRTISVP